MDNEMIVQYLTALGAGMSEYASAWAVDDSEEKPVLVLSAPAPFDEEQELGYLISISRTNEELFLFDLQISVFMNVSEDLFSSVHRVIAAFNNAVTLGCFELYEETSDVIFRCGVFIDPKMTIETATDNIMKTLAVMENAAVNGGAELQKLLKGEATADELINAFYNIEGDSE